MFQKPKWASFTLPNVERGEQIYRDPPASVHTRKWEPVSEADVLYNYRQSQVGMDRLTESISWLARGTNPMVDVDYNNSGNGARTTTMPVIQTGNPYKAFRNGAFRPPIFTLDALQPLSRQRFLNPAVSTNPVVPTDGVNPTLSSNVDRRAIFNAVADNTTTNIQAQPSMTYRIALPTDVMGTGMVPITASGLRADERVLEGSWHTNKGTDFNDAAVSNLHREVAPNGTIVLTPLVSSTTTNPGFSSARTAGLDNEYDASHNPTQGTLKSTNKQLILGAVKPNFALVVHDNSTDRNIHVPGTIQDRKNIAVQAALGEPLTMTDRTTGEPIRVKDYRWKIIQTTAGSDALVVSITPDNNLTQQRLMDLTLDKKVSMGSVNAPISSMTAGVESDFRNGVNSMQARSTNATIIHNPASSLFRSSAAENTTYQGGYSMGDRQTAANITHQRRESRKARASDVRKEVLSTAHLPTDTQRTLRLRKGGREAVTV